VGLTPAQQELAQLGHPSVQRAEIRIQKRRPHDGGVSGTHRGVGDLCRTAESDVSGGKESAVREIPITEPAFVAPFEAAAPPGRNLLDQM